MPSKPTETTHLLAFLRLRSDLEIRDVVEREIPDFLVASGTCRVGIEHTTFSAAVADGYSHPHEQATLRRRVVDLAGTRHSAAGGSPLSLAIEFSDHPRLSKKRVEESAADLARLVAGLRHPLIHYRRRELPSADSALLPAVRQITGHALPPSSAPAWLIANPGWPSRAGESGIQRVVSAKEGRLAAYREACEEVWLLIVFDSSPGQDQIKAPSEPVKFAVDTAFDRIFCLDVRGDRCVEVPRRSRHGPNA
jgi:hypothetical protein